MGTGIVDAACYHGGKEARKMSDEQMDVAEPKPGEEPTSEQHAKYHWGAPISEGRQAWLRELADRQQYWTKQPEATRGDSVFKDVKLTGADTSWLAEYSGRDINRWAPTLHLEGANLAATHLEQADLRAAHLERANLAAVHLEKGDLRAARLEGASLRRAYMEGVSLREAHLEGADLYKAHMEATTLREAHLERVNFTGSFLDKSVRLNEAILTGASLDQMTFDDVNLTVLDWSLVPVLGDEITAWNMRDTNGKPKDAKARRADFQAAVRANRVLAVTLRSQGMNEDADRYFYRAQVLQRQVFRRQGLWGQWAFSLLLSTLAGYGYRLGRIVRVYALVVIVFALAFLASDMVTSQVPLTLPAALDALQISLNAVHGRVFFAQFHLDTIQSWIATTESIVGIVVEGVFVAMLVQRFFAR